MKTDIYFILFRSIHDVLKAEKFLKKKGTAFELVPVPRQVSSECGVCIRSAETPRSILPAHETPDIDRCYLFNGTDYILIEIES